MKKNVFQILPTLLICNTKLLHKEINLFLLLIVNSGLVYFLFFIEKYLDIGLFNEIVTFTIIYNISFVITDLFFECEKLFIPYRVYPVSILTLIFMKNIIAIITYYALLVIQLSINIFLASFNFQDIINSISFSLFILPFLLIIANILSIKKQISSVKFNFIRSVVQFIVLLISSIIYILLNRIFQNNLFFMFYISISLIFIISYVISKILNIHYLRGGFYV